MSEFVRKRSENALSMFLSMKEVVVRPSPVPAVPVRWLLPES
ncbi:MAG: hypothetical protein R3C24_07565 [Cyanobacteriota/Melainabacteria group bacterium]